MGKVITGIIVVLLIGVGGWYYMMHTQSSAATNTQAQQTTGTQTTQQPLVLDSSDASIDADIHTIDGQIQASQSDSAAVDQSLSDKPVQQTE